MTDEERISGLVSEVLAELARVRADLVALRETVQGARQPSRLLSLREAARDLGISRSRTLPALIRERRIRVVTVNGKPKIPMDEIQRVAREGTLAAGAKTMQPVRQRNQAPLARDLA